MATVRDHLVAQVEQALEDIPLNWGTPGLIGHPDYHTMAAAAVDAVAIFVYEQLASGGPNG